MLLTATSETPFDERLSEEHSAGFQLLPGCHSFRRPWRPVAEREGKERIRGLARGLSSAGTNMSNTSAHS